MDTDTDSLQPHVGLDSSSTNIQEQFFELLIRSNAPPAPPLLAYGRRSFLHYLDFSVPSNTELHELASSNELSEFIERRASLLGHLKGFFSPLRRFPPEMLGHIFAFCRDNSLAANHTVCDEQHALMVLGNVCSRWRAVLRSMPELWSDLHFSTPAMMTRNAAVTQHLLGLSRNRPLSLRISTPTGEDAVDCMAPLQRFRGLPLTSLTVEEVQEIVMGLPLLWTLRTVVDKLETLTMVVTAEDSSFSHFVFGVMEFCTLSELSISVVDSKAFDFESFLEYFRFAPSLRRLAIKGDVAPLHVEDHTDVSSVFCSNFAWHQLTTLTINMGVPALEARDILCLCTGLEIATFSELADQSEEELEERRGRIFFPDICTLSSLRRLSLTSGSSIHCCDLLERMSFPKLESLTLDLDTSLDVFPIVLDLVRNSRFHLLHLNLCQLDDLAIDELCSILMEIPSLETLSIEHCDAYDELIEKCFTYPCSEDGLPLLRFPRLRTFILDPLSVDSGDCPSNVLKLVESLSHYAGGSATPCPVLGTIRLPFYRCNAEEETRFKQQLASVCADGFNLEYLPLS
ncbi:hypothetical protein R3P38DRAFT_2859862 [Favolaschia claudopus]|uniref:F-box domain-containing protein n=1 Tax=Favolaschia claudopus TaxID=2862362 RepID=A0AAW0DPA5_9AGAR